VTEGADKLVEAVRGVDAVVCVTGFRRSIDPFAPWKVCIGLISRNWQLVPSCPFLLFNLVIWDRNFESVLC
jgi:hypothetical protein